MVVTLQLVASDANADDAIEVTSEIVLPAGAGAGCDLADAVATRARDAALHLLEQLPASDATATHFVPLADFLRRV